jgi:hypothetical protein
MPTRDGAMVLGLPVTGRLYRRIRRELPGVTDSTHIGQTSPMVDLNPTARWHFSVHLCHRVLGGPSRPRLRPDLMAPQQLTEPAATPRGRARGLKKWHKVAVFGAFFEHPHTARPGEVRGIATSVVGGLSSTMVPASVRRRNSGKVVYFIVRHFRRASSASPPACRPIPQRALDLQISCRRSLPEPERPGRHPTACLKGTMIPCWSASPTIQVSGNSDNDPIDVIHRDSS